jgi:hypothetical protein
MTTRPRTYPSRVRRSRKDELYLLLKYYVEGGQRADRVSVARTISTLYAIYIYIIYYLGCAVKHLCPFGFLNYNRFNL